MPVSISLVDPGYVVDANVLSLLARSGQLGLLDYTAFPLFITSTIQQELEIGFQRGVHYLAAVLALIEANTIQLLATDPADSTLIDSLPKKLGQGKAEAIAICKRHKLIFITHDRKAINYCDRMGIDCIPLLDLLLEFQEAGLLTAAEVAAILA